MRFYTGRHRYYCGIDVHARTMYLCVVDHETGEIVLHRNMRSEPEAFLRAIAPYREDLVVGAECIFCWYWLADLCADEDIFLQKNPRGQRLIHRLRSKHGRAKALSILAARLGRASYFMLRRSTVFDMDRFVMS